MGLEAYNVTKENGNFSLDFIDYLERNVSEIYFHPNWNRNIRRNGVDADIAILVLSYSVTDEVYRPVLLPERDNFDFIGRTGYTVSLNIFQRDELPNPLKNVPTFLATNTISTVDCFLKMNIPYFSSSRTFCVIEVNPMLTVGNSGAAFFALTGASWVQYGLASAVSTDPTGNVYPGSIGIYQNITLYIDWIVDIVKLSEASPMRISDTMTTEIELQCNHQP